MAQMIEVTPKERPNQTDSVATSGCSKERVAREALRRGLYASGVYHDDLEFFVDGCVKALQGTGLLEPSPADVVTKVEPNARAAIQYNVFRRMGSGIGGSVDLERQEAEAIVEALRSEFGPELTNKMTMPFSGAYAGSGVTKLDFGPDVSLQVFHSIEVEKEVS